jgi:hypothetical protein
MASSRTSILSPAFSAAKCSCGQLGLSLTVSAKGFSKGVTSIRDTPAMRAKLTERIWTLEDLFGEAV